LWLLAPFLIACGIWLANIEVPLQRVGIRIPSEFALVVVFLPFLTLAVGHSEALKIINGHDYFEARFLNSGTDLRYLGRAGDYVFFWNSDDKDTEIFRLDSIQPLTISRKRNRH
jgi:hypothetical protein